MTVSPTEPLMARQDLRALHDVLEADGNGIRAFVIFREGQEIFAHHRADVHPEDLQSVNSVTKSVVGMLVGMALREGVIRSVHQTLGEFFPEARRASTDERVQRITIGQLLTMTSGFAWDERIADPCLLGKCARFDEAGARLRFILDRPLAHEPGGHFQYDSHAAHLLSILVARATGRPIDQYARDKLFAPLGIKRFEWLTDEEGNPFAGRGLRVSTRDMAKLGLVMAAGGLWHAERLIDESFVTESSRAQGIGGLPMDDARYGYLWWIGPKYFFAAGFGEQYLIVDPRNAIVAAVCSDNGRARKKNVRRLFEEYVFIAD